MNIASVLPMKFISFSFFSRVSVTGKLRIKLVDPLLTSIFILNLIPGSVDISPPFFSFYVLHSNYVSSLYFIDYNWGSLSIKNLMKNEIKKQRPSITKRKVKDKCFMPQMLIKYLLISGPCHKHGGYSDDLTKRAEKLLSDFGTATNTTIAQV